MDRRLTTLILALLLLSGCTMKIVPEPVETGLIDPRDNSQTVVKGDMAITVRSSDTELFSYNLEGTVAAFYVTVDNIPATLKKVKTAYRNARIVVPGHGDPGGPELIDHTLKLCSKGSAQ